MIGPLINVAGILLGCGLASFLKNPLSIRHQSNLKAGLGALAVFWGLKLTLTSLHGSPLQFLKQLGIVIVAMAMGKLLGRLLRLQKMSNRLGRYAARVISEAPQGKDKVNNGFLVCTTLFCAAPLAMLGSVQEGLNGWAPVFIVKAIMDGAAVMTFSSMFGRSVALSVIPVFAFQAVLARGASLLVPLLRDQPYPLLDAINATNGLLIFCVALVILQLKKIEVTDYLPSLALAPLLMKWLW